MLVARPPINTNKWSKAMTKTRMRRRVWKRLENYACLYWHAWVSISTNKLFWCQSNVHLEPFLTCGAARKKGESKHICAINPGYSSSIDTHHHLPCGTRSLVTITIHGKTCITTLCLLCTSSHLPAIFCCNCSELENTGQSQCGS